MSNINEVTRNGKILSCPFCKEEILYTTIVNWFVPTPFFYSNKSNDVLLRESDGLKIQQLLEQKNLSLDELNKHWNDFINTAPLPPNGGQFTLWANVKCPHCGIELPYNDGIQDLQVRIYDAHIILIDGSAVVGDKMESTWKVKVNIC